MTKYQCTKCKYQFEKDKVPSRCPYCSREGTVQEIMDAQDILDEVTSEQDSLEKDMG